VIDDVIVDKRKYDYDSTESQDQYNTEVNERMRNTFPSSIKVIMSMDALNSCAVDTVLYTFMYYGKVKISVPSITSLRSVLGSR